MFTVQRHPRGIALHTARGHPPLMGFWTPNIDRRGRIIRAVMTLAFAVAAWIAHREGIAWLAVVLAISALVGFVEAARGWCVLRACKIKTRF